MAGVAEYTITEAIGESAAQTIYRGYRTQDGLPVTIKRLKNDPPTASETARLKYEYTIAKDLALPGVVRVYGLEKVGDNLALIMEDTSGRALSEIISSRKLGVREVLLLGISITDALESVHRAGVIHMDIKPHNIIVNKTVLEAKITD